MLPGVQAVERWLDEGWSPWRIGVGTISLVSLGVTVYGYAAHPHHPGSVWWLLGAALVMTAWSLSEMLRWRVRHNRLRAQVNSVRADLEDARRELEAAGHPAASAPTASGSALLPLVPRYDQSLPYRRASTVMGEYKTEHHVGIRNPDGNPVVTGVRLEWTAISPQPRVANPDWLPMIPCAVPKDTGGDPAIGIDLSPGRQELWGPISTWIGPDGLMAAREFADGYATTRGDPSGFPYRLQPGDRLRFTYRIVADNLPHVIFSLVVTAADGHIQCDLEG